MTTLQLPTPQPKQQQFFKARRKYVGYGGARGGGKTWGVRIKAVLLALFYAGIKVIILRKTYPELWSNHILPLMGILAGVADYKDKEKAFIFPNGSRIEFGYCQSDSDLQRYQGQEYDIIFIDEATQFPEVWFIVLTACLRGVNDFPKRMYLTCNPGGVGHAWVKRLFIDRDYREGEDSEEYEFIQAKVTDNQALMTTNPGYLKQLDALPDGLRQAWRDGNWDVYAGQYFTEFKRERHVIIPRQLPEWYNWYVTMDYGLDMLAAYLVAVDEHGMSYVTAEIYEGKDLGAGHDGLIVYQAAEAIKELMGSHNVVAVVAPPDMWSRQKDTGKSMAEIFAEYGVYLTKASAERVAGWMAVKEALALRPDEWGEPKARLYIFETCKNLIRCLPLLQYDDHNPNDTATEPHEITHAPDALRYYCSYRYTEGREPPPAEFPRLIDRLEKGQRRRSARKSIPL